MVEEPLQTAEAVAAATPPTLTGLTVTVDALESSSAQPLLWTIARNCVVAVRGPVSNGLAVEAIGDQVFPSGEDSHLTMEPV
jgi:type IV secretory pathway VirB2 component (pilin)